MAAGTVLPTNGPNKWLKRNIRACRRSSLSAAIWGGIKKSTKSFSRLPAASNLLAIRGPLRENIAEAGHTLRLLTRPFESGAPVTNLVFGYQRSKPKSPPIHQSILAIINLADSIYHIETNHPDAELT
jgi:hypothetical protein